MGLIDEVKSFDIKHMLNVVAAFVGIIAPGFLIIYLFRPELIISLDVAKIVLFSSSLTMPVLVANYLLVNWTILNKSSSTNGGRLSVAMTVNMGAYCFSILITYLLALQFKGFLGCLLMANAIILLVAIVLQRNHDSKAKQS